MDLLQQVRIKVVGFVGDSGPKQTAIPAIPLPANMWKWKSMEVSTSEIGFAPFFGADGNQDKLWAVMPAMSRPMTNTGLAGMGGSPWTTTGRASPTRAFPQALRAAQLGSGFIP